MKEHDSFEFQDVSTDEEENRFLLSVKWIIPAEFLIASGLFVWLTYLLNQAIQ